MKRDTILTLRLPRGNALEDYPVREPEHFEKPARPFTRIAGGRRSALPFIGRQRELDLLRVAYGGVCAGQAKLALIIGPPGQGKSRLASEMVAPLRSEAAILEARCRPGEETGSETPLRQLVGKK